MSKRIEQPNLDNICGILESFVDFSKRLFEIATENDIPYDEIWMCWKEQRDTAGNIVREETLTHD